MTRNGLKEKRPETRNTMNTAEKIMANHAKAAAAPVSTVPFDGAIHAGRPEALRGSMAWLLGLFRCVFPPPCHTQDNWLQKCGTTEEMIIGLV